MEVIICHDLSNSYTEPIGGSRSEVQVLLTVAALS